MEERDFQKACKKIIELGNSQLSWEVNRYAGTWSDESRWTHLLITVRKYVQLRLDDAKSLEFYAAAANCSTKELQAKLMEAMA